MGQKVNPIGLRLNIIRTWESTWYAGKDYSKYLLEDQKLRKFLKKRLYHAGLSRINIARTGEKIRIKLHTARPGIVIGKKGSMLQRIGTSARKDIEEMLESKVLLKLFVKVTKDWVSNERRLSEFGY